MATPILSKTVDGQPSFLRTQPPPSTSYPTMQFDFPEECEQRGKVDRRTVDQKELMLQVLPDLLSATDTWTWTYKVSRLLRSVFECDRIELFMVSPASPLEGELYLYDEVIMRKNPFFYNYPIGFPEKSSTGYGYDLIVVVAIFSLSV